MQNTMAQDSILQQGTELMLFGMGSVFVFLTLLVFTVTIMSWVIGRFFAEPSVEEVVVKPRAQKPGAIDPTVLSVIQDAVHQHRAKQKK